MIITNKVKLMKVFSTSLGIDLSEVNDNLEYNTISQWDSVGHMALVATLEKEFDVMFDTDDIIDMSSVRKAKEILLKNGVKA